MADRWTNERDRDARDRAMRYSDWRYREGRRQDRYQRGPEGRTWADDGRENARGGVTTGGAMDQGARGYGSAGGPPRFAGQDYTGGQYGSGRAYGQGYRGEPATPPGRSSYRRDRAPWADDDHPGFAYIERYEARAWDMDDDGAIGRDYERRGAPDPYARADRYERGYRALDEDRLRDDERYRVERRDRDRDRYGDEGRGEGAGDFLHRAGERISSWFRGDNPMHGGRDEERRGRDDDEARPLHRGAGPKGYRRSDERINDDVHQRLTDDPWVDASDIDVEVKGGEITLSGHVDTREAKHRAERLIEDLSGVRHVQNNLRVDPSLGLTSAGRGYGSSALEAQMRRNERATDPGNNGVSGLSGRTSTGAAAERSSTEAKRST